MNSSSSLLIKGTSLTSTTSTSSSSSTSNQTTMIDLSFDNTTTVIDVEQSRKRLLNPSEDTNIPLLLSSSTSSTTISPQPNKRNKFDHDSTSKKEIIISLLDDDNNNNSETEKQPISSTLLSKPISVTNTTKTVSSSSSSSSSSSQSLSIIPTLTTSSFFSTMNKGRPQRNLLFIRHGETRGYHFVDTCLSNKGKNQASNLLSTVPELHTIDVLIISPLYRALETAFFAFQKSNYILVPQQNIQQLQNSNNIASTSSSSSSSLSTISTSKKYIPVYITPLIREKLHTPGDIGRNPSIMIQYNKDVVHILQEELIKVPNYWWRHHEINYSTAEISHQPYLNRSPNYRIPTGETRENDDSLRRRVTQFRQFLHTLPEHYQTIGIVSHANFINGFVPSNRRLDFCESIFTKLN